MAVAKSVDKR